MLDRLDIYKYTLTFANKNFKTNFSTFIFEQMKADNVGLHSGDSLHCGGAGFQLRNRIETTVHICDSIPIIPVLVSYIFGGWYITDICMHAKQTNNNAPE